MAGVPGLADAVGEICGDHAIGAFRVREVIGVTRVRRGGGLLLLGGNRPEGALVDRRMGVDTRLVPRLVLVVVVTAMAVGLLRKPVQARTGEHGEQEAG